MSRTLFQSGPRNDGRPARPTEDSYAFLNRVDQPYWGRVRDQVEGLYARFPAEGREDLGRRFRSQLPGQHYAAWWELYLFGLFDALGFSVRVHPNVEGVRQKPDFQLDGQGTRFNLEAVTTFVDVASPNPALDAAIVDMINTLPNRGFFLHVEFPQRGSEQPRRSQVLRPINEWLGGLDREAVRATLDQTPWNPPRKAFEAAGWLIECVAFSGRRDPSEMQSHRLVGIGPSIAGYVNDAGAVRNALKRKVGRYDRNEQLVLALLVVGAGADIESIEQALFGRVGFVHSVDEPGTPTPPRELDGLWLHAGRPQARRVSAVLTAMNLLPWSFTKDWPRLWPNPWAMRPLTVDLPFPTSAVGGHRKMGAGDLPPTPHAAFDLPADWPGPEAPFVRQPGGT